MPERPTHAEILETVAAKAKGLREAGVTRVEYDGVVVVIAPEQQPIEIRPQNRTDEPVGRDWLDDPETHGGPVPTLTRRRDDI